MQDWLEWLVRCECMPGLASQLALLCVQFNSTCSRPASHLNSSSSIFPNPVLLLLPPLRPRHSVAPPTRLGHARVPPPIPLPPLLPPPPSSLLRVHATAALSPASSSSPPLLRPAFVASPPPPPPRPPHQLQGELPPRARDGLRLHLPVLPVAGRVLGLRRECIQPACLHCTATQRIAPFHSLEPRQPCLLWTRLVFASTSPITCSRTRTLRRARSRTQME